MIVFMVLVGVVLVVKLSSSIDVLVVDSFSLILVQAM